MKRGKGKGGSEKGKGASLEAAKGNEMLLGFYSLKNLIDDFGVRNSSGMEWEDDSLLILHVNAMAPLAPLSSLKPARKSISSASVADRRGNLGNLYLYRSRKNLLAE